jgi:hypothetical protein
MQMNDIKTESHNFTGSPAAILSQINDFLAEIKKKNASKSKFHLVHALVFSKAMSESEVYSLNTRLSKAYKDQGFFVLGGDTSSGNELSIFISTIVF